MPLLDEGPEILGPELFGSSGRRRHGSSVRNRDGVPQQGPSEGAIPLPLCDGCKVPSTASARGGDRRAGELGDVYRRAGRCEAPYFICVVLSQRSAPSI